MSARAGTLGSVRRCAIEAVRGATMGVLMPFERRALRRVAGVVPRACFILGPPRSGTTLLYELMLTRFQLAYFSNLAHRFYLTPATATRLGRHWTKSWQGRFESRYGHIEGWGSPNEGGWIWNRWFPETSYLDENAAAGLPVGEIRATVAATAGVTGAPFLNKNVMHSVHMRLLDALFPNCLFVELRRDPAANIRSILAARRANAGPSHDGWWSVKPLEWERYRDTDAALQAAAQVHFIHQNIDQAAAHLGPERRLTIDYEALCANPRSMLDQIGSFLRAADFDLLDRRESPAAFPSIAPKKLEPAMEARIQSALESVVAT